MQSVLGLPPAAFCLHLAAKSNAAIASNVLLSTPVSRRNTWPFSFLTESNLIAASLWAATNHPDLKKGLCKRSNDYQTKVSLQRASPVTERGVHLCARELRP